MNLLHPNGDDMFDRPFNYTDPAPKQDQEICILEAAKNGVLIVEAAADNFTDQQLRSMAMSVSLTWVNDGEHTFEALDALAVGMIDLDDDGEVSEDEEDDYNDLLSAVAESLIRLGASAENVVAFIDDEDDDAGAKLGEHISGKLTASEIDDDEVIMRHVTTQIGDAIFEATVKVVRNGKVVLKKKRIKKYRMSAAQRQALKKARRKANSSTARRNRRKSMRMRKQRNLG